MVKLFRVFLSSSPRNRRFKRDAQPGERCQRSGRLRRGAGGAPPPVGRQVRHEDGPPFARQEPAGLRLCHERGGPPQVPRSPQHRTPPGKVKRGRPLQSRKDRVVIQTVQVGITQSGGLICGLLLLQNCLRGEVETDDSVDIQRCVRRTLRNQGARRTQQS